MHTHRIFSCILTLLLLTSIHSSASAQGTAVQVGPAEQVSHCWYAAGQYFMSTNGGFYRSIDATTWTKIHSYRVGLSLAALPTGEIFVFDYDKYEVSTDDGAHWSTVSQSGFSTRTVVADSAGTLFAGQNDPIYFSKDKGATWTKTNSGASPNFFDVSVMVVAPDGYLYAGNQGITGGFVYRSTDHGAHWKLLHTESMNDVLWLEVYPSGLIVLWYADKTLRSDNGGSSWTTIATPTDPAYPKSSIFLSASTGYALASGGRVVRTNDGGVTWDSSAAYFDRSGFSGLFLGADHSIFASSDHGLYALHTVAGIPERTSKGTPLTIYPNPATDRVTIESASSTPATIAIYDASGRLVLQTEATGTQQISTASLSAGAYTVRRSSGSIVASSPLVIVR